MDVVIAGGVESMTRVPLASTAVLPAKNGMGHYQDGVLRERYPENFSQFTGAEMIAKNFGFSKDELDAYALRSHQRAAAATRDGAFDNEIFPIVARASDGTNGEVHRIDEGIRFDATLEAIQGVKLLREDGVITAATASQICDGASAALIVNERGLKALGVEPMARVHHLSVLGHDPVTMLDAPLPATLAALKKTQMTIGDIDLFEVNEAFAPVPLAWLQATGADPERLNVNGGAIALGHPLGASGTKLMATLVHALRRRGKRYGLQTMCEGGGMANVTIVERL
jgi:acetyl-CoA C-acetyltransferase